MKPQDMHDFHDVNMLHPCQSPYCECERGKCSHRGFYDARHEPKPRHYLSTNWPKPKAAP